MENTCLCYYPCKNENCPKEKGAMCYVNHCEVIEKYSILNQEENNCCPKCGRRLR